MMTYVLVLFFHVGPLGDGNSNATTNIPRFLSLAECQAAGRVADGLTKGSVKSLDFVCLPQSVE